MNAALGRDDQPGVARWLALVGAVASFLVTIPLYDGFNVATSAMQFVELKPWIERFGINYHLGVDGISVLFILLNSFITILVNFIILAFIIFMLVKAINRWQGAEAPAAEPAPPPAPPASEVLLAEIRDLLKTRG